MSAFFLRGAAKIGQQRDLSISIRAVYHNLNCFLLCNAIEEHFFRFLSGFRCIFNVIVRPKKVESFWSCVFSNSALTQVDTLCN